MNPLPEFLELQDLTRLCVANSLWGYRASPSPRHTSSGMPDPGPEGLRSAVELETEFPCSLSYTTSKFVVH